jgi:hypothetical protein
VTPQIARISGVESGFPAFLSERVAEMPMTAVETDAAGVTL